MTKPVRDELLANIEEEDNRLSRFVANLLHMTKIEGGAVKLGKDPVDVADVVAAAVRRARQTWPQREIVTKLAPAIRPVAGDAALLEQLVVNLLDNAHKYSPAEGPTTVSIAEEQDHVALFIEDEGPGIAKDELERIFEKFYRVKGCDGRSPGTGLGLAICRGIANAMGGIIQAESPISKGRGTRIVVRFPKMASP
jgi:two-component system sensor histidine kinase KdpD